MIKGKTILLICENFYNYDLKIRDALLKNGAKKVELINSLIFHGDKLDRDTFTLRDYLKHLKNPNARKLYSEICFNQIQDCQFDFLLCIENVCFEKDFFERFIRKNPSCKKVLFLWDTVATRFQRFFDYLPFFDKVCSFDRDDAVRYNFSYVPDFYNSDLERKDILYDISFVGTANSSTTFYRINTIRKIKDYCDSRGLSSLFYLKYRPLSSSCVKRFFFRLEQKAYYDEIDKNIEDGFLYEKPLPLEEVNNIYASSKCILDLNHENRQGLTINAVTAIANNKKLITTNRGIKNELFYNPSNICVIDSLNPIFDESFFSKSIMLMEHKFMKVEDWVKEVLS